VSDEQHQFPVFVVLMAPPRHVCKANAIRDDVEDLAVSKVLCSPLPDNLASDLQAELKLTVEISADFPNGAADQIKRAVSENAKSLGFKTSTWE
jgi:hypothetical protein